MLTGRHVTGHQHTAQLETKAVAGQAGCEPTYDDLINIFASQDREAALMQVHDGQVLAPPL